ncbi:MAG: NCS2 family permease [Deltaproteobacteria bacterium]|nr:MAG: NCS2 family permease [Deltaproteobacteria bacterium]
MRWFVRGDIDGFFGLALDNLIQLLLIDALCRHVVGLPAEIVHGRILPGVAVSLVVGNVYYARTAMRLARQEGRDDVCALPYGINTVSLFAHVFLVMLPAKLAAEAAGAPDPGRVAWIAGIVATVGSGLVETLGAFVAEPLRRLTPRAAMLATLAGIALGFISLGFLLRTYAHPVVGLASLAVLVVGYFGRVRFGRHLPAGLVAVAVGTALSWATGLAPGPRPDTEVGLHLPVPAAAVLAERGAWSTFVAYFSVILPMGLFNLVGSLQNVESAAAAGDRYDARPALAVNGLGSLAAAAFGSCFPTTIYIGHPGWKAMGARAGYSVANAVFMTVLCLSGTVAWVAWAVPVDAGMAVVLWIGLVITAQAFTATPAAHAPAVVLGILPGLAAWGVTLVKTALRIAGLGTEQSPFGPHLAAAFAASDTWIEGGFALEQGFVFSSMLLAAATVAAIERRFAQGAAWLAALAILSATGLVHGYRYTTADVVLDLSPAWPFVWGYGAMALVFLLAGRVGRPVDATNPEDPSHP